jgi:prepilin-type N-terminal cleavage/methylation domain-containing protein
MRRLLARLRAERGFTVVEVLVAASLGSVVMVAIFGLLDFSVKQSSGASARVDSTQRGRTAMEQVTRSLRSQVCPLSGTSPVTHAGPYRVEFWAFSGPADQPYAPELRAIEWDTNTNSITQTAGTSTQTLLTNVRPPTEGGTSAPIFEYHRILSDGTTQQLTANPVATADLARVSVINVRFTVDPEVRGSTANATSFESQVFVRTADPNNLTGTTDPDCS